MQESEYRHALLQKLAEVDAQQKVNEEWRDLEYYGCLRNYRDFWDEKTVEILEKLDARYDVQEGNGQ